MRQRPFGRTGLEVSELVFGGGFVGGILIHADDDTKLEALRYGLDGGMNWIDTAPSYGNGQSEEALGWLLREIDAKPYLSTKVRLDLAQPDLPGQIEASLEQSLKRLKRDSVDLFQLHNPIGRATAEPRIGVQQVLGANGVAETFDRLRDQGLFRFTGITALGEPGALREVIASGRFDSAQVYYNLLDPSAGQQKASPGWSEPNYEGVLGACREHGVATMNIRVLAAGVIATDVRHGREMPIVQDFDMAREEARVRAVFAKLGDRYGTRAQTAIRFAMANPDITCVVVGFAEIRHIEEALAGAEMGPLPEEALAALRELYRSPNS